MERTILHRGRSAVILAVNLPRLIEEAKKANGVIEFAPQVGDFVGAGEPLFLLHGGAAAIDDELLRECVIFGSERTMEQDPLFAIRILVDIAIKALSAAINDPTTAVLAIDQLHRLLRSAGRRNLRTDSILDSVRQRCASFSAHPIGMISSTSPSSRFAFTAHRISRSRGGSAR